MEWLTYLGFMRHNVNDDVVKEGDMLAGYVRVLVVLVAYILMLWLAT